ncbi:hypothetical protein PACTADRAFT_35511 [Pachysolen tannophilus NRRL Y-2460]|uniref:histidinol-phosphate transaminase n=1 Tax=Pachysolen tannophilus NRRL Y-2460 TaxID=669874 RepID=A0A1E4TPW9_PACTA|nr:hypothetical protein PACTADRAFT_35511 [Pachysolen tannophilus NRRL Y-2460]
MGFNLKELARQNILSLTPYHCARDDFTEGILLDANENTHGPASIDVLTEEEKKLSLNRYPDPNQVVLKQQLCDFRNQEASLPSSEIKVIDELKLKPENLCLGVGSDESIDALIRVFCKPGRDKMLVCPPTYGMYSICATVNDVEVVKCPLELCNFQIQPKLIKELLTKDPFINLIYITTPGNPTAKKIEFDLIKELLNNESWNGVVIADEAYIDFAPVGSSLAPLVNQYPNLVVLQTLSKSFGLAGIRLGITFAHESISILLNSMKYPYNISNLTSDVAIRSTTFESIAKMRQNVNLILENRSYVEKKLLALDGMGKNIGGLDANFLLLQVLDNNGKPSNIVAQAVYNKLAVEEQVVVRFRGNELGCTGCLRITIGTKEENEILITKFKQVLEQVLFNESKRKIGKMGKTEIGYSDQSYLPQSKIGKTEFGHSDGKLGKTELGKTELGKTELGKTEIGKTEIGKSQIGKTELGKTEIGKTEFDKTDSNQKDK